MTRAIRIHATGGPEVLRLEDVEVGIPGPGQVLLRHEAIGLNFIDTYHRSGLYPLPALPSGLGLEASGVVEAVGAGVPGLAPGQRVAYAGGAPGAYAERRVVAADRLVVVPEGIDADTAAAALLKGMTVEYLIHRCAPVEAGQQVLWHAAAGGVGLLAAQWLRARGVRVMGTAGSEDKARLARERGCEDCVVYRDGAWVDRVREWTGGRGVAIVYDSVGRATFEGSLACLARRGTLVGFGNASGPVPAFTPLELARRGSLYLTRPTLFDYTATRAELELSAGRVFSALADGTLTVDVGRRFALAEAAAAHRALEARETTGASLLLP
ncbi:MAG: quinone oxidoreductase [Planctomycetota bacterium]